MRIPFDIKFRPQIESGEYKVETRDGRPARIVCYNRKFGNQLVALATEADGRESYISCNSDGRVNLINECSSDLFTITPEPEESEDEKAFLERVFHQKAEDLDEENREIFREDARCVLELARKQLRQEQPEVKKIKVNAEVIDVPVYFEIRNGVLFNLNTERDEGVEGDGVEYCRCGVRYRGHVVGYTNHQLVETREWGVVVLSANEVPMFTHISKVEETE